MNSLTISVKLAPCFLSVFLLLSFIAFSQVKDEHLIDSIYYKGKAYYDSAYYAKALPFFMMVDSISKENNIINESSIRAILARSEISRTTFTHEGVEMAYDLQVKALNQSKKIQNEELTYDIYVRLADIHSLKGNTDSTKYFLDLAFDYYTKKDEGNLLARVYLIYMNYYYEVENLDSARIKLEEGIAHFRDVNKPILLARILVSYGGYFTNKVNQVEKSIAPLLEAKQIFDAVGDTLSRRYFYLAEDLAIAYASIEDYQQAYEHYKLAYTIRYEFTKKMNQELSRSLETKYQAREKEREVELLTIENKLTAQQKRNQLIMFIGIAGALLILSAFLFVLYRNRQKTNRKLMELDTAKSNFFANISHEFRTPLTLIKNPVEDQLAEPDLNDAGRNRMEMIDRNADRLLSLVEELLDLAKIDAGSMSLKVKEVAISTFMKTLTPSYEYAATKKGLQFKTFLPQELIQGWCDPDVLEKIISNLLGNAIKYTPQNGDIQFSLSSNKEEAVIVVKNTVNKGQIIDSKKVFERFYRSEEKIYGAGIGLALVKELVELHHGTIISEQENNHVSFEVRIPVHKQAYSKKEINSVEISDSNPRNKAAFIDSLYTTAAINESKIDKNEPLLLIVEDNEELAELIQAQFKEQYQVLVCKNGIEGIEVATKYIPDLIISDVMMPLKDGIELAETLKTDERTSHIPIILLTAKAEEKDKLQGVETGADDYITKPFNKKVLSARVQNLIEERAKLRRKYSQEVVLHPKEMAITSEDEKFLQKLQDIIDNHLTDSEFNAEAFSREVNMSRMQLHRKLKGLLGITATEFIRTERLKMAAHLLTQSKVSVSEVVYAVGFNEPSYFTKCFKEVYGVSPKAFTEENLQD